MAKNPVAAKGREDEVRHCEVHGRKEQQLDLPHSRRSNKATASTDTCKPRSHSATACNGPKSYNSR